MADRAQRIEWVLGLACGAMVLALAGYLAWQGLRDGGDPPVLSVVAEPAPPGEIRFTCGMGRYHGQIELRPQARSSIAALRSTVGDVLRRGWRVIRGPIEPTVAREAREIVRAGFARARSAEASPPELARGRASPSWETPSWVTG